MCMYVHFVRKGRPRNGLYCVGWDVKPYTLTHTSSSPTWAPPTLSSVCSAFRSSSRRHCCSAGTCRGSCARWRRSSRRCPSVLACWRWSLCLSTPLRQEASLNITGYGTYAELYVWLGGGMYVRGTARIHSQTVSVLALVVVSIDRYVAVLHPLRSRVSRRTAAAVMVGGRLSDNFEWFLLFLGDGHLGW